MTADSWQPGYGSTFASRSTSGARLSRRDLLDSACERLRPRGYECVVVCARPRHAGHRAWPAIQGRLPVVPLKPADVAAVVEQFQHASPYAVRCRTPPTELQFIDELRAAVGRFLCGHQTAS